MDNLCGKRLPKLKELRAKLTACSKAVEVVRASLRDFSVSTLVLSSNEGFEHQNERRRGARYSAVRDRALYVT